MNLFSKKHLKNSILALSLFTGMIFSQPTCGMVPSDASRDERRPCFGKSTHIGLKKIIEEEIRESGNPFTLVSPSVKCVDYSHALDSKKMFETLHEAKKYNAPIRLMQNACFGVLQDEIGRADGGTEQYLRKSFELFMDGQDPGEFMRRFPFLIAVASSDDFYWKYSELAFALVAPFENIKVEKNQKYFIILSIAENIFFPFEYRATACQFLEMESQFTPRILEERIRGAIQSLAEDESSSQAFSEKKYKRAKEILNPGYYGRACLEYDYDHERLAISLQTAAYYLAGILADENIDYPTKIAVANFLNAPKEYDPEILGKKVSNIGKDYLKTLSVDSSAPVDVRIKAIGNILYPYSCFSPKEKEDSVEQLLILAQQTTNSSQTRLQALSMASSVCSIYSPLKRTMITVGYPIIEGIFGNPSESIEDRINAGNFFTFQTGFYTNLSSSYYREERGRKDNDLLLAMIRDSSQPRRLRESLVKHMPYSMQSNLLEEIKTSDNLNHFSFLPNSSEAN